MSPKGARSGGRSIWASPSSFPAARSAGPTTAKYQYKVEGSTDQKTWSVLSDQTKSKATSQVHKLKLKAPATVRYVRSP